jgi:hypothetical protein
VTAGPRVIPEQGAFRGRRGPGRPCGGACSERRNARACWTLRPVRSREDAVRRGPGARGFVTHPCRLTPPGNNSVGRSPAHLRPWRPGRDRDPLAANRPHARGERISPWICGWNPLLYRAPGRFLLRELRHRDACALHGLRRSMRQAMGTRRRLT